MPLFIIAKHFKSRLRSTFLTLQLLVLAKFKLNLESVVTGSKSPEDHSWEKQNKRLIMLIRVHTITHGIPAVTAPL